MQNLKFSASAELSIPMRCYTVPTSNYFPSDMA